MKSTEKSDEYVAITKERNEKDEIKTNTKKERKNK